MTDGEKDLLAAQLLAVIRARFDPPGPAEIVDILERASRQAHAPAAASQPTPAAVSAAAPVPAPDMRLVDRCLFALGSLLLAAYFFRLTRGSLHVYFSGNDLMNLYQAWIFSAGNLLKTN